MSKDLDRHCARLEQDLSDRIARLERICARFRRSSRCEALTEERNRLVIELHDISRTHRAYDARRAEVEEDATGQDAEGFDYGESSHGWTPCGGGYLSNGRGSYRENFGY